MVRVGLPLTQPPKAMLSSSWTVFPGRLSGCFSDGLARRGLTGVQCVRSQRPCTHEGLTLGLMLCCHYLEILNDF